MDQYAFARSITIFCFLGFFLGNNLEIFLWLFIYLTFYLIAYRVIRFWTKRYLLYLLEFCYLGNAVLLAFLLKYNQSQEVFSITFICNTGIMTMAVIVFNNQTQFNSTDHLTSSWIHTLPLITNWAIRWRHIIYSEEVLKKLSFEFNDYSKIKFDLKHEIFIGLFKYPVLFWCFWAVTYLVAMGVFFRGLNENPKFCSGLTDFKDFAKNTKIFGDSNKFTILKYLLQHFAFFVLMFPLSIWSFYNFYVNTLFIIFIILFLGWNTARNNIKHMNKQKSKTENLLHEELK